MSVYSYMIEKKIRKNILLSESVVLEVEKRLKNYGGKLSPLIQNLLVTWCKEDDRLAELQKKLNKKTHKDFMEEIKKMEARQKIEKKIKGNKPNDY